MITDTIQNALKRLFCSIGGNADNVRNKDDINAILDEMSALALGDQIKEAGASKLPAVTNSDNGKILGVADGVWDKVDAPKELPAVGSSDKNKYLHTNSSTGALEWDSVSGGAEEFVITCTPTAQDLSGTVDKTNAEIFAAYQAGKKIVIQVLGQGGIVANVTNPSSFDFSYTGGELTGVLVNATFVYRDGDVWFLVLATAGGADGTYSTTLFPLTPYSP